VNPDDPFERKVWPRIGRRAVLTKIVKVAGLAIATPAAVEALVSPARAQSTAPPALAHAEVRSPLKPGPRFGPDGLMSRYVEGVLAAKLTGSMVLSVPKPGVGSVRVAVPKGALIRARGFDLRGDLSQVELGDTMAVATYLPSRGDRVTQWAVANSIAGRGIVTSPGQVTVVVQAIGKWQNVAKGRLMTITIGPTTQVNTPSLTTVGSAATLQAGVPIFFTGHSAEAGTAWPNQIWGASIFQLVPTAAAEWNLPWNQAV
jgi:hypothetical protein